MCAFDPPTAILYNSAEDTDAGLDELEALAREQFCYLTTTGRKSGKGHTIEIWFGMEPGGRTLYMLSGGGDRSDWVRNIGQDPEVRVRIGGRTFEGRGRFVEEPDEERTARRLVVRKYYGRERVASSGWEAESLPVAVDLRV